MPASPSTAVGRLYYGRHRLSFRAGTYLALVRMMGVAHLVTRLYGHARLVSETEARLARTRQTVRDLVCEGFDAPAGRAAVERLRTVHRPVVASAEDYRYVLGTFFLEPLRWNEAHARVRLDAAEHRLLLDFWLRVGAEMGLTELPTTLAAWRSSQRDYEARHLAPSREGRALAALCLRDVVKLTVPPMMRVPFRQLMVATMEPAVRDALGIAPPGWGARLAASALARLSG